MVRTLQSWSVVSENHATFNDKTDKKPIKKKGESGVGKTTFVNTLFTTTIKEPKNLSKRHVKSPPSKTVQIQITKAGK